MPTTPSFTPDAWANNDPTKPLNATRLTKLGTQYAAAMADVAADVDDDTTPIGAALSSTFGSVAAVTDGKLLAKNGAFTQRTVVATGHSLFYGQESGGPNAPVNGATINRSANPTTAALASQANYMTYAGVVLVNQTFPGDRTAEALTRWAAGASGDVEFFWIDTNDANDYGSHGGVLTDAQTAENMTQLATRARDRGAPFIVIGGVPQQSAAQSHKTFASADTERVIAERLGGTYIDAGELLAGDFAASSTYWTDGVHLVAAAYDLIGARLAGLLGVKGVRPPRVSPGRIFTWRDQVIAGQTSVATVSSPNYAGSVLRLAASATAGFPFWAETPVVPLVKFRAGSSAAVAGLYTNLVTNRAARFASIAANDGETVAVLGQPTMSPGPSGLVIRAESGQLDILSVEFLSIADPRTWASRTVGLGPVGGRGQRVNGSWDPVIAWDSGVALRSAQAQTAPVARRFLFDLRLGPVDSGVLLVPSVNTSNSTLISNGLFLFRTTSSFVVRVVTAGSVSDTTYTSVFGSSGTAAFNLEVAFDGTDLKIYTDGTLRHTIAGYAEKYLMAGLIAGANTGNSFAAGSVSIN